MQIHPVSKKKNSVDLMKPADLDLHCFKKKWVPNFLKLCAQCAYMYGQIW